MRLGLVVALLPLLATTSHAAMVASRGGAGLAPARRAAALGRSRVVVVPRMFFDQFDKDAMRVIMDAQSEARNLGGAEVGTQHILLAATLQKDSVQKSLERGGLATDEMRRTIAPNKANSLPPLDKLFAATSKDELLPFAKDTERAFRASLNRCQAEGSLVSSKELILSVLQDEQADTSALKVLLDMKLDRSQLYDEVQKGELELVGAGGKRGGKNSTLAQCSVDLTARAREGKLDPVVGRSDEVRRCLQVLVRRRKNNPVLLGDPGVGKTAIAEGLAQLIVDGKVPAKLLNKRLLSLELGMLVADTKYRGEFEERLKSVVDEVTASNDTILFIDELHTLVGAGAAEGAIDAANLLKPALARGELQCVGATTVAEYRRYIEKDAALERRFQPVDVPEPTVAETVEILRGLQDKYAEHHEVTYAEEALEAAAKLAERYINDRFLPDKAIDLIDEAAAVRAIDGFEAAGGRGGGAGAAVVVGAEDVASVVSQWTGVPVNKLQGDEMRQMLGLEDELHRRVIGQHGAVSSIARALRRARVGLRNPTRPVASLVFAGPTGVGKTELAKAVAESYYGAEKAMVRIDMSEYMEAHAVSRLTGPPPGYVGYEAGGQLTEAVRRNPHSVVLLDEVEKAHPDVFNLLLQVLDDGRLTDNKGRVVSFRNALLVLTSNVGSRAILDVAQRQQAAAGGGGGGGGGFFGGGGANDAGAAADSEAYRAMRSAVKKELGGRFRPEFLNRLDEVIVFSSLDRGEVSQVAQLMLDEVATRSADNGLPLRFSDKLKATLVEQGFSSTYGARPLRRAVQRVIEDPVAEAVLDDFAADGQLDIDVSRDGALLLKNKRGQQRTVEMRQGMGIEDDLGEEPAAAPGAAPPMDFGLEEALRTQTR